MAVEMDWILPVDNKLILLQWGHGHVAVEIDRWRNLSAVLGRFNGATATWPWKYIGQGNRVPYSLSFNGATATWPWKFRFYHSKN